MAQKAGACVLFGLLMTTACGVGSNGGGSNDDPDKIAGITCRAAFKTTGSFVAGTPGRPTDPDTGMPITGCWPVGTWTFTATVDAETTATEEHPCSPAPSVLPSYSFKVDRTDDPSAGGLVESYTWNGDQASLYKLSVSEVGSGCQGGLELYSADNTEYWNMKPLMDGTTITGFGEYAKYATAQR